MRNSLIVLVILLAMLPFKLFPQVKIVINASSSPKPISKYLYGRNNSLSGDPGSSFTPKWTMYKDAGLNFLRESGGNNCTKYNWKRKISSHPDWYNNVYANDWDFAAKALQQNMPNAQGMWAFQLLGKAAKTTNANFNDWGYNGSNWWKGVTQNVAGGGTPNPNTADPNKALVAGNIDLYLEDWTPDSTTSILPHWFNDLSLDKNHLRYWNMDNEVEIWSGTHDDVMPNQLPAEDFMQRYFAVAKKARAQYPEIKLVGPVTANEWQWYNWNGGLINSGGKNYSWLEFFIKRAAEEQNATGIKLLDVLDIHFYPGSSDVTQVVQMHRVYFDKNYVFPEANGLKKINGGYDNSLTKEYIFERCKTWLDTYFGIGHGITLGVTETGVNISDPNGLAVWYASTIGEFTKHPEVEIFSPWSWNFGMWEVLHLSSRYNKPFSIPAISTNEDMVSAYPTINATKDSITVMVVNRSTTTQQSVTLTFNGFTLANENFTTLKLSKLPSSSETFISHLSNALQKSTVTPAANSIILSLPPLSIITVQLKGENNGAVTAIDKEFADGHVMQIFPNPSTGDSKINLVINKTGEAVIDMIDLNGKVTKDIYRGKINSAPFHKEVELSSISKGIYFVRLNLDGKFIAKKVLIH